MNIIDRIKINLLKRLAASVYKHRRGPITVDLGGGNLVNIQKVRIKDITAKDTPEKYDGSKWISKSLALADDSEIITLGRKETEPDKYYFFDLSNKDSLNEIHDDVISMIASDMARKDQTEWRLEI